MKGEDEEGGHHLGEGEEKREPGPGRGVLITEPETVEERRVCAGLAHTDCVPRHHQHWAATSPPGEEGEQERERERETSQQIMFH